MKGYSQFGFAASILLAALMLCPANAQAQRGMRMGGVRVKVIAPRASNIRVTGTPSGFSGTPLFGFGNAFGFNSFNDNLGIEAAIDPATQWRLAERARFRRNGLLAPGYGYFLLDDGGYVTTEPAESEQPAQPQVIVIQQPVQPAAQAEAQPAPASDAEPVVPDAGPLTLVLRDGNQIEAVAFTHEGDQIVYITPEGSRHTLAVADLDSEATVRVNQERGTPLQLPL